MQKKPWTKPKLRAITPYAEQIEILRRILQRAREAAALHPADREAAALVTSLQRQLAELEASIAARHPPNPAA